MNHLPPDSDPRETPSEGADRLSKIRDALLALHKTLVDSERERYELAFGPIPSPNHFLNLLTSDPWFAWLHPLSQLIVAMDEALEEKEPLTLEISHALTIRAARLLVAAENGEGFSGHYDNALQNDPAVILAHSEVIRLIKSRQRK